MASTPDIPSRRADAIANRRALIDAATDLFGEHGIDVPFDRIAREAGVGRATLYRHFPTRELLLAGILEGAIEELEEAAAGLPPEPASFMRLFEIAVRIQELKLPLLELLPTSTRPPALVRQLRTRIDAVFREPLRLAQEAGAARDDLEVADVRTLLVMLSAVGRGEQAGGDRPRAERLARRLLADPGPQA
jgi:AcrR family transcriptional regulator